MKITPLQDRIVVKRDLEESTTAGGIIIAESAKEKPSQGKVISVGKGKKLADGSVQQMDIKAGDRVLFSQYAGDQVKIDGEELLIIKEEEIFGIIS
jgi:chaperonin GroES